jgi:DNA-binding IclR family transcriptional regulator
MGKCSGITRAGTACKGVPIGGSQWCFAHHPDRDQEERRRHGARGGKRGGRGRPVAELAALRVENAGIRRRLLEGGEKGLTPNVAAVAVQSLNADARLVVAALKAREQEELEGRLDELERILARKDGGSRWGS